MSASASAPPRATLSPLENLGIGALGGCLETLIQMPLLTLKFCTQEGRALPTSFPAWYRGVAVQAGTVAPITALQMAANGVLGSLVLGNEKRELTSAESIATACGAGIVSAVVYSPVDLTTIQQQKLKLDPISTLKHLMKQHGTMSVGRGFMACAIREGIYTAGYLGLAPVLTSALAADGGDFFRANPFAAALTGACTAGTLAALLTHPVDTAKTVIQADISGKEWTNARTALPRLLREGGVASLYKGGLARTVRLCGAFFICMSLREAAIEYKTKRQGEEGESGSW